MMTSLLRVCPRHLTSTPLHSLFRLMPLSQITFLFIKNVVFQFKPLVNHPTIYITQSQSSTSSPPTTTTPRHQSSTSPTAPKKGNSPPPPQIEVEQKFLLRHQDSQYIRNNARFCGEIHQHDVYYDKADYSFTKNDIWLRQRNGKWECKFPVKQSGGSGGDGDGLGTYFY